MKQRKAFSYSFLNTDCKKYQKFVLIDKIYQEAENPALKEGKTKHSHLERGVKYGDPLPPDLAHLVPFVNSIRSTDGYTHCEQKLAIDAEFKPCGWFHKSVFFRSVLDLIILDSGKAGIIDWKTGKRQYGDIVQLEDQALCAFCSYPDLQEISAAFVWTRKGEQPTKIKLTRRKDLDRLKTSLLSRVQEFRKYEKKDHWPATPGFQCRSCPVIKCYYHPDKQVVKEAL